MNTLAVNAAYSDTSNRIDCSNANAATVSSSIERTTIVRRVVHASLFALAPEPSEPATERVRLDTYPRRVTRHTTSSDVRIVHADVSPWTAPRLDPASATGSVPVWLFGRTEIVWATSVVGVELVLGVLGKHSGDESDGDEDEGFDG